MNEEQKDKGLKRAVKAENEFRLPSNFAYRTMRKMEEAMRPVSYTHLTLPTILLV